MEEQRTVTSQIYQTLLEEKRRCLAGINCWGDRPLVHIRPAHNPSAEPIVLCEKDADQWINVVQDRILDTLRVEAEKKESDRVRQQKIETTSALKDIALSLKYIVAALDKFDMSRIIFSKEESK